MRVLRAKFALGLFEHPYVDPDSAAYWNGNAEHRRLAREAAQKSIVLLRNEHRRLPLAAGIRSIAVIGVDASEARLGGYSGPGIRKTSILDGIRERAGNNMVVRFAPGPGRVDSVRVATHFADGMQGEYFDNPHLDGPPKTTRRDARIDFNWTFNSPAQGVPRDFYSVRWSGELREPGAVRIGVYGNDGYRLWVDDKLAIDAWDKQSFGTRWANVATSPSHRIRLEFRSSSGNARLRLLWEPAASARRVDPIDSAVAIARASDVAVVVAGIEEGEFRDRAFLKLPGRQEELIQRIAAAGKPVVVVLVGGSAITMSPWLERVDAVLDAWYPGEEGGHAIADVLFGDADPAGRLPVTFPMSEGQLPLVYDHKPTGRGDDYLDLTGQPLFPFGYGMSYTTFDYSNLVIEPATISPDGTATVRCTVTNTGARAGDEVVQLYVRDVLASVARPVAQLEGFARVHLAPGEKREIVFRLSRAELQMLDRDMRWIVEPGVFRIGVGSSSKDIRLRGDLTVK
jgi:beta-glucosidase